MSNFEDFFSRDGYRVRKDVEVMGLSGIKHYFPLLLIKNGEKVAVDFSEGDRIEIDLMKLIIKCWDSGISKAFLILNKDVSLVKNLYNEAGEKGIKILSYSKLISASV